MSWAMRYVAALQENKSVTFKARDGSLDPKVKRGQAVTVAPIDRPLEIGDVVLCRVHGVEFLNEIKDAQKLEDKPERFLIGPAEGNGKDNGWTFRSKIYGLLTRVEGKLVTEKPPKSEAEPALVGVKVA